MANEGSDVIPSVRRSVNAPSPPFPTHFSYKSSSLLEVLQITSYFNTAVRISILRYLITSCLYNITDLLIIHISSNVKNSICEFYSRYSETSHFSDFLKSAYSHYFYYFFYFLTFSVIVHGEIVHR